jgi:hypothetical protein
MSMKKNLYVTLLVDNDASMDNHMKALNEQLKIYTNRWKTLSIIIDIISYDGLKSQKQSIESETDSFIPIEAKKLPLLSTLLQTGYDNLKLRSQTLEPKYRSWLILLTHGRSLETINVVVDKIRNDTDLNAFFLPIGLMNLNYSKIYANVSTVFKKPITLVNYNFEALFNWLDIMIKDRLSKDPSEKQKLNKEQLEGWATI